MFHVEIRSGIQVVREFNLTEQRLWLEFLAPLMADRDFVLEGHDFTPRHTRLTVYEGPELRPDQLGMGRGWQNVERRATDVTERVLERARHHTSQEARNAAPDRVVPAAADRALPAAADLVRERLIGRIAAGPVSAEEILGIVTELTPSGSEQERLDVARHATWAVLERGGAQLTPSGR